MYISERLLSIFFLSLLMDIILFKINGALSRLLRVNHVTFSSISDGGTQIKSFINFFSAILATSSNVFSYTIYTIIRNKIIEPILGVPTFQIICAIVIIFDVGYIIYIIYNMVHYRIIKSYEIDESKINTLKSKASNDYITKVALEQTYNIKSSKITWIIRRLIKEDLLKYNKNSIPKKKYRIK